MMPRASFADSAFLSKPQLYGGFGGGSWEEKAFYSRGGRQRLNIIAICQCLFWPWLLFCFNYVLTSFSYRNSKPVTMYVLLALVGLAVFGVFVLAWRSFRTRRDAAGDSEPKWYVFLAVTLLVAFVLGIVFGNTNFKTNMGPYYSYKNLNEYSHVNPGMMRGAQVMDAGRVYFEEGAQLDLKKSMGFKNLDTYCVAPITFNGLPLATYDFWAVGLNCCSGNAADFHCGEYLNPDAKTGLRFLRDDDRAFLRLAVEQAEATYAIKSEHPLFFYWSQDADGEMEAYRDEGYRFLLVGIVVHFLWQLLCVGLVAIGYAKVGQPP